MVRHWKKIELLLLFALATAALFAAEAEHATLIREEALSISAGANAQKTALSRATSDKVEQVEELNARSAKYNLPKGSATER